MAVIKDYLPVLIQIVVAVGLAVGMVVFSVICGKIGKRNAAKDAAYECGKIPEGQQQPRFAVKFYLVAMIFILFDIEVIFMYPWAVNYAHLLAGTTGIRALWAMLTFVLIVEVAHLYAYKKGVFDWNKSV